MSKNRIYFDGVCNLCNGFVHFLIRIDKKEKLVFSTLQSESGKEMLKKLGIDSDKMETAIFRKEEHIFTESDAIIEIFNILGGFWKVAIIFKLLPSGFRNRLYKIVSRHRYSIFGKKNSCMVPTDAIKKRFTP